ncbi:uncharacterized protein LOC116217982 [Clupea harengus]|uniref:Uncharacterized protein LOC116217982 n=1 Tax=Clupea harengus TaxID=7950 RepID=A0A8M1K9R2_CLUHA|nr:uncharacterized protein LOC116217982 [Clupea harengus]
MATGTPPDVMMTFHCELKDVMATLLDAAVMQILKLVQKDFLDKLKHNEQEIQVFQERLKMVESLQKERADETREKGKEKTCQPEMRAEEKQRRRETGTELSTNEFEVIEELAGDKGNTEDGVSIHKNKVENAGGDEEHGGVGAVRGTGSDIRAGGGTGSDIRAGGGTGSDIRAGGEVDFTGSGGNAGKEIQREKEGQKRRGNQKRLRVKSEMEDGGDIMNEKRSSLEELVVLKVEDPLHGEGTQSPASSESPGGADLQVYLLEDHDNLCNGIFCCDATSVKNVLKMEIPTSLNESTAQSTAVAADSQLSDGVKRNRSRSSLPAFYPQTKISQDALAEVKVALTKMEGLPDSGWVLLDPVTGHFCVKADLDSVTAVMGREGRGDAPDGPGADPGVSCTQSVGMGVQMTTNSNTQTEAQITVTMSDDEVNLNSTAADGVEPNRVLTRSSKANRANSSSAKTTETNDVHSQRGCTTRSNGNRVAPRIDECVEKSANTASCPSGPPAPMRAVHTDSLSDPPR